MKQARQIKRHSMKGVRTAQDLLVTQEHMFARVHPLLERADANASQLKTIMEFALRLAAVRAYNPGTDVVEPLRVCARAGARLCATEEFAASVGKHPGSWFSPFYAASCVKDESALESLAAFDVSRFSAAAGVLGASAVLARGLVRWHRLDKTAVENFAHASNYDEGVVGVTSTFLKRTVHHHGRLFFDLANGAAAATFNADLAAALTDHKKYYGHAGHDKVEGLLPMALLTAVCAAKRAGVPIEVQSDYLVDQLLELHD